MRFCKSDRSYSNKVFWFTDLLSQIVSHNKLFSLSPPNSLWETPNGKQKKTLLPPLPSVQSLQAGYVFTAQSYMRLSLDMAPENGMMFNVTVINSQQRSLQKQGRLLQFSLPATPRPTACGHPSITQKHYWVVCSVAQRKR